MQQVCIHVNPGRPCSDVRCDTCPFRYGLGLDCEAAATADDYVARPINFQGWPDHLPDDATPADYHIRADRFPENRLPPRLEGFNYDNQPGRVWEEAPEDKDADLFLPIAVRELEGPDGDTVDHPPHYARWAMEPIEFIAINDLPWWLANVVKYTMRFDAKDGLRDLYKARSYLDMKIRHVEGQARFWEKPVAEERRLKSRKHTG